MTTPPIPPGYASDPVLGIMWGPPPPYTGNVPAANGSGANSAPYHPPFRVNLPLMYAAEQGMLYAAQDVTNAYNTLDQQVQAEIQADTMFGQDATYIYYTPGGGTPARGVDMPASREVKQDTGLQQGAVEFAKQINPAMTRALRMIADATEMAGVIIAMLDKTGQIYTAADKHSVFGDAGPVAPLKPPHDHPGPPPGHGGHP
jgi:hypothetical protein